MFFFLVFYCILLKIYLLALEPLNLQAYVVAVNTLVFFNAKSFFKIPQSFHDYNIPGTPVYYLTNLLFYFKNFLVSEIYIFLNIFHILTFVFFLLSVFIFIRYFKQFVKLEYIFIFLIILISFDTFLLSLEVVDYLNFKIPLTLLIIVCFHQYINNPKIKNLLKIIFLISLANSIILSFVSLTIPVIISLIFYQIKKKLFSQLTKNLIFNLMFMFFLNLPIIGRFPKVLYNVFHRADTGFNFLDILSLLKKFILYIYDKNYFFIFIILLLVLFFLRNFILILKKSKKNSEQQTLLVFGSLLMVFFFYTVLASSNPYFNIYSNQFNGTSFRNIFISSSFIFIFFLLYDLKFKKKLMYLSFSLMIFSHYHYIIERKEFKQIIIKKERLLKDEIENINTSKNIIIFYSDLPYGIGDFAILSVGNYIFSGEKFTNEIFIQYPKIRFLRLNDLLFKIRGNTIQENKYLKIIDKYLNQNVSNAVYLYLTPLSHKLTSSWIGNDTNSLFIQNQKQEKGEIIIFNNTTMIGKDFELVKKYIKQNTEIKNYKKKNIMGDTWHFFF